MSYGTPPCQARVFLSGFPEVSMLACGFSGGGVRSIWRGWDGKSWRLVNAPCRRQTARYCSGKVRLHLTGNIVWYVPSALSDSGTCCPSETANTYTGWLTRAPAVSLTVSGYMATSGLALNCPGVSSCNCTPQPANASTTAARQEKLITRRMPPPSLGFLTSAAESLTSQARRGKGGAALNARRGPACEADPRPYCARRLLLLTSAGSLGRPEGNSSPHGLLLNGRRGTPELLRDLAGRSSRFRERLQGLQLTGAPGSAIVRGTFRHYSILQKTPNCRVGAESYTLLRKKARPTSRKATNRHVVGSGQLARGSEPALRLESGGLPGTRSRLLNSAGLRGY